MSIKSAVCQPAVVEFDEDKPLAVGDELLGQRPVLAVDERDIGRAERVGKQSLEHYTRVGKRVEDVVDHGSHPFSGRLDVVPLSGVVGPRVDQDKVGFVQRHHIARSHIDLVDAVAFPAFHVLAKFG